MALLAGGALAGLAYKTKVPIGKSLRKAPFGSARRNIGRGLVRLKRVHRSKMRQLVAKRDKRKRFKQFRKIDRALRHKKDVQRYRTIERVIYNM